LTNYEELLYNSSVGVLEVLKIRKAVENLGLGCLNLWMKCG